MLFSLDLPQPGRSHLTFWQLEEPHCLAILILNMYKSLKAPYQTNSKAITSMRQPSKLVETRES